MSFILRVFILSLVFGCSLLFGSIGKVSLLKGDASLERSGAVLSVKNGMELEEKDSIKTSKGSQIQLIFTDKTVITLGSESDFKVAEYLSEGSSPKAKFKFNQGVFKTITGQIGKKAPDNFTLETKTATIGIRGTVIGGVVPPPSSPAPDTIICLGGRITATSLQTGVKVNLPTGTITFVPVSGPPAPPRQTTPQDIAQFNQSLGTPPPPPAAPASGSGSSKGNSSSSSQGEAAPAQSSSSSSQSEGTPAQGGAASAQGDTAPAQSGAAPAQADNGGSQPSNNPPALSPAMSLNETPPPPAPSPSTPQVPQTFVPTAAVSAQQTSQQNLAQTGVVGNIAQELGVPIAQIQQQIVSGSPIVPPPPTPPVIPTPPPVVTPTPPPVIPTPPPVVVPTPPPVIPTPPPYTPPSSGDGGYTPPPQQPQTPAYTTLFSNMLASNGTSSTVFFPNEITKTMVFDSTNKLWKSSDSSYIVTSTDGNFSYINSLSGTQTMYVKDLYNITYNPIVFKSFPSDANASGYLSGVSGLKPIPSTWHELVTSAKSVMGDIYNFAIKYEQDSYTRKWHYADDIKLFNELYYLNSEWAALNNYAALYSDISNPDTSYQSTLTAYITPSNGSYSNFYIYGVPDANQTLKNYGKLDDGGKWYFTYDMNNSNYSGTKNVYGTLPITDAVVTSNLVVPFMSTTKGYPVYTVNNSGYKEVYSVEDFNNGSSGMNGYKNDYFSKINTQYVTGNESNATYYYTPLQNQQNVYLFHKIDDNGTSMADLKNDKMVNPVTGKVLNVYANYHLVGSEIDGTYFAGTYAFGPINNPNLGDDMLPIPPTGHAIVYSESGITPLPLNFDAEDSGADFRKLAIEKAPWADKPNSDYIYVFSDYSANLSDRNFTNLGRTQTYIRFPADSNNMPVDGIMMDTHFDVLQERGANGSGPVVKNYLKASITTGRVVQNETDSSNKLIFKHFDSMDGIITSSSTSSIGTTHNMYLFNENGQFVNPVNGGLDNDQENTDNPKYSWFVHEEVDAATSKVVGVDLMKKVADSSDTNLFISNEYNTTFATGAMSGFMVGGDTLANIWMGDISAFDTNASGGRGVLTIVNSTDNNLSIASPISMVGLTQTDINEAIPSASYLGEDMQAMIIENKTINGKTYDFAMSTLPDAIVDGVYSYQNDYSSWGYWVATEKNVAVENRTYAQGYWVAGYETPAATISAIPANTTYSYSGNVLGSITNGTLVSPIKLDSDNSFQASIQFGVANPVVITEMKFNTVDLGSVTTIGTATTPSNAISGNTFSGVHDSGSAVVNFKGKFYGPNAESIGGAWSGTFNSNTLTGTGVFKATGPQGQGQIVP